MKNSPLVSILIPCYNSENYIKETLESCVQQVYKSIEIIVIDDHSRDDSFELIKKFQAQYPKLIKLYTNLGKGACAARNYAFELSSGEYIQYLDADDMLNPVKIDSQLNLLLSLGKESIASCQWGKFTEDLKETKWKTQEINKNYENPVHWLIDSWRGKGMGQTSIWLTPRSLIEKAGPWNEELKINQDGEFFCRVLLQASAIQYSKEAKVYYRSGNPDSISQSKSRNEDKASSLFLSYQLYQKNILQHEDSEEIRQAVGNNYLNFIYQFNKLYPDLADKAKQEFFNLGLKKMWPVGGANFKRIARILGFNTALRLKTLFD